MLSDTFPHLHFIHLAVENWNQGQRETQEGKAVLISALDRGWRVLLNQLHRLTPNPRQFSHAFPFALSHYFNSSQRREKVCATLSFPYA